MLKIKYKDFEKSYGVCEDEYSNEVDDRFMLFLDSKNETLEIHYKNIDELIFNELTAKDKEKVKSEIEKYSY